MVHPQHWPEDLDYAGKRVVVIGSGATAVTIIPAMAKTAALVTMLQRSPTYIVSRPSQDAIAGWLRRHLPVRTAYSLARWYNVLFGLYLYNLSRRKPEAVKNWIVGQARQQLGDDYDVTTHFTPRYNPWDQRLCLAPDADFFHAIKSGKADVVTDQIETFTADRNSSANRAVNCPPTLSSLRPVSRCNSSAASRSLSTASRSNFPTP